MEQQTAKKITESAEASRNVKVLAIVNANTSLMNAITYLTKQNFAVQTSHNLLEAINLLNKFKPDIIILSWNLKNTDVKKVHPVIVQKFSAICFVVAEDDSKATATGLGASGLPNIIQYPIGGVGLFNRINSALGISNSNQKVKVGPKREKTRENTFLGGIEYRRPKKSDIPTDSKWRVRVTAAVNSAQIWETILYKEGKPQYCYYKGEKPPEKWLLSQEDAINSKTYVFTSDTPAGAELLRSFQDYSEVYNFESEKEDSKLLEIDDLNAFNAVEIETVSTKQPEVKRKSLLEKSVNIAIDMALKSEVQSFEQPILIDEVSKLTVSIVKSPSFKGYLVSGQAGDVTNPKFMKKVFQNLKTEMEKHNETLSTLGGVLELNLETIPYKKWVKERADFDISSKLGNEEISFAFIPVEELPQSLIDEELAPIAIEKFEENKTLYFDIFLHMPLNQKHVLYQKNGSFFSKESIERLKSHNIKVIYVKKSDENLFFAYSARNLFEHSALQEINRSIPE